MIIPNIWENRIDVPNHQPVKNPHLLKPRSRSKIKRPTSQSPTSSDIPSGRQSNCDCRRRRLFLGMAFRKSPANPLRSTWEMIDVYPKMLSSGKLLEIP